MNFDALAVNIVLRPDQMQNSSEQFVRHPQAECSKLSKGLNCPLKINKKSTEFKSRAFLLNTISALIHNMQTFS